MGAIPAVMTIEEKHMNEYIEYIITYDKNGNKKTLGQIVRCRDCKYAEKNCNELLFCTGTLQQIGADDYCSFAERRSEWK